MITVRWIAVVGWLQIAAAAVPAPQVPGGKKAGELTRADAGSNVRVFSLKNAEAEAVRQVLTQIFDKSSGIVAAADTRINSVIVLIRPDSGATEFMERISKIIEALDVPGADRPSAERLEMKLFTLKNIVLDEALGQQLRVAISDRGRIALDPARNAVVAHDTPEALVGLEALIRRLDLAAADKASPVGLQIRIVWLISGAAEQELPPPPDDLKGTVTQLAKAGVQGLRMAAQTIVATQENHEFHVQCSPDLESPCDLEIEGEVTSGRKDRSDLHLRVTATQRTPSAGLPGVEMKRLCNLDTTVSAPLGHTVVLGLTPIGKSTSVFVIQLTASD